MIDNENQSSTGKDLEYYRLGFMPLLEELSDIGFRNVKAKFIAEKDRVVNYHKERSVSELLNLMCESGMLIEFNRISFAKVLNSLSPIGAFWTRPIVSYVDDLVTLINEERISQFGVKEAEEALGYLSEMVNMCKNCIGEKNQSESIQYLVDIYKTVSCLNQVSRDSEYKFQVNRSNLNDTESKLELCHRDMFFSRVGYSIAGGKEHAYIKNPEELKKDIEKPYIMNKRYARFLSWILIEMICDQDGIVEEMEEINNE